MCQILATVYLGLKYYGKTLTSLLLDNLFTDCFQTYTMASVDICKISATQHTNSTSKFAET
jgi:hypothetical protein